MSTRVCAWCGHALGQHAWMHYQEPAGKWVIVCRSRKACMKRILQHEEARG